MPEGHELSPHIAELYAKQSIYESIIRMALAIDRGDLTAIEASFWADGRLETGTFSGPLSEYVPYLMKALLIFTRTSHAITNVLIEVTGERARSQAYFNAYHMFPSSPAITVAGRYIDQHERRGGEWRIAHRLFVLDWHIGGNSEEDFPICASRRAVGGRKPNDPWYRSDNVKDGPAVEKCGPVIKP